MALCPTIILHNCLPNCSKTFHKILGPCHTRSGDQARSSNSTSGKLSNHVTATVMERNDLVYCQLPITLTSQIFYVGDLWSGQVCDLLIISPWKKLKYLKCLSDLFKSFRVMPIWLLLMTLMQVCICDPLKCHLRPYTDVMMSIYAVAHNFRLDSCRGLE